MAIPLAIFIVSACAPHRHATLAAGRQVALAGVVLACTALVPRIVAQGLLLPWGRLPLSMGPIVAIAYNERGRKRAVECFAVR